jgi:hypothetical protein
VADNVSKRSGWITFAGVIAVLAGGYNALSGIAALVDDDAIASQAKEVLYGIDLPPGVGSGCSSGSRRSSPGC